MTHVLLIGHSHITCVIAGFFRMREPQVTLDTIYLRDHKMVGGEKNFPDFISEAVETRLKPRSTNGDTLEPIRSGRVLVLLSLGGNSHSLFGLIKTKPAFDLVLSSRPDLPLDKESKLLPEQAVKDTIRARERQALRGIEVIKEVTGRAIFYESPPPIGDDDFVRANLDPYFRQNFKQEELANIVSPALRYKLWRLSSDLFREHCESLSIPYVTCPDWVMDDGMFLKREAYANNVTHGNDWYGEQVLRNVLETARKL